MAGESVKEEKKGEPKKAVEADLQIIEEDLFEDFPADAGDQRS